MYLSATTIVILLLLFSDTARYLAALLIIYGIPVLAVLWLLITLIH